MDSKLTAQAVNLYLHKLLQQDINRIYPVTHMVTETQDTGTDKPREIVLVYRQYKRNTPTAEQIASDKQYFDSINPTGFTLKTRNKSTEKELAIKHLQEDQSRTAKATKDETITLDGRTKALYNQSYKAVISVLQSTINGYPKHPTPDKMKLEKIKAIKRSDRQIKKLGYAKPTGTKYTAIAKDMLYEVNHGLCKALTGRTIPHEIITRVEYGLNGEREIDERTEIAWETMQVTWLKYLDASGLNVDDLIQTAIVTLIETNDFRLAMNAVSRYIADHGKRLDDRHLWIDDPNNYGDVSQLIDVTQNLDDMFSRDTVNSVMAAISKGISDEHLNIFRMFAVEKKTLEQVARETKTEPKTVYNVVSLVRKRIISNVKEKTGAKTNKEAYKALQTALANGTF